MLKKDEKKRIQDFNWAMLSSDWFLVKIKFSDWVEGNFFSLKFFGGNSLAGDEQASVTMDRQHLPTHLGSTLAIFLLT